MKIQVEIKRTVVAVLVAAAVLEPMLKHRILMAAIMLGEAALSPLLAGNILEEIAARDEVADAVVASIRTVDELKAKQAAWRAYWLDALGEMPARTPLNARVASRAEYDGFRLENIIFESQPGVYVTAHLALPMRPRGSAALPVVLMPLGHSDAGILNPRYAAHLAMAARAGFAAFAWDPISQGERRQACDKKYDYTDNCSTEHSRLGARGWLVGWNFARFRIWDAVRAIDYVESRPDLYCSRLGIMGTSGGGTMSAYMQAFDPRVKVAFPNCYISSLREVIGARGCHDAEQFFFGQLQHGFNHAALLAMGQPRVALATGSRWQDYFPHVGAISTFTMFTNMTARLGFAGPYWHFHCDGPHGLPPPTRAAQVDWMRHCIQGASAPNPLVAYHALGGVANDDPANSSPLPFPKEASRLAKMRTRHTRGELREIVRRRAGIRPLADLPATAQKPFDHPKFGWWYLPGVFGTRRENEAAMLATLGRSVVGRDAENIIIAAAAQMKANGGKPVPLVAKGWNCIAAAHAYAAEPQLFSEVRFSEAPPSWTELVRNPDPTHDSYAIAVWGALKDYDWPDLIH